MDLTNKSTKDIGNLGEKVAVEYLKRNGFQILETNFIRKTGEVDIVARKKGTLYFVEVKSISCTEFKEEESTKDAYDPSINLHPWKIRKVARTAEWYVADRDWEGEWQIDGILVWLRKRDGLAKVRYLPQIA